MKYFRLAGAGYRTQTDLTIYEADIKDAVKRVKPKAVVDVQKNYFTTTPELSKRESIAVSTILRHGAMAKFTTYRPCLFNSTPEKTKAEMEEENVSTSSRRKKMGGRHRNSGKISTDQ